EPELDLMNLANGTYEFRGNAFAFYRVRAALPFVEDGAELGFIALLVGAVGFRHHTVAADALFVIGREVRMDAPRDVTIELLEILTRREIDILRSLQYG